MLKRHTIPFLGQRYFMEDKNGRGKAQKNTIK
jgi:hypothetical protein